MPDDPFFTVVIPVHNKGPHVRRAIDSVISQTFPDFELLVVDDASTDDSLFEVQRISDRRMRILYRDEPGPGGYAARNLGIREARASWVAFLDADDEWLPGHLEKMKDLIASHPECGLMSAGWESILARHVHVHPYYLRSLLRGKHTVDLGKYLAIAAARERFCCTSIVVLSRARALEVGGFPEGRARKGGDLYLWIKMLAAFPGGWSPHIGARVYRDAVNMVTRNAFFSPSLWVSMLDELAIPADSELEKMLKQYINSLLLKDYLRSCAEDGVRAFHLGECYQVVDLKSYCISRAFNLIPPTLIHRLSRVRRSLMQ